MATDKTTIKEWFKNGKKPDESQFAAWIDSYWHKEDEKIDLKAVNGLESALNNKTEKLDFNDLSSSVENHITNQNVHITESEKNKLSNLTENLDGYIKKGETALILQLNLFKDENEDYYLNETTQADLEQFLKKYRATINLQLRTYNNDKEEYWYLTSIYEKIDEGNEYIDYKLTFLQIQSGEEKAINCESFIIDVKTLYEDDSIQDIKIARDIVSLVQDFDSNRYDTTKEGVDGDPDMDNYTESGGIAYSDPEKNIVGNLPEEATKGFGFVVGNDNNQALQIIRDEITGKIYHRGRISEIEWSKWAEMGGGSSDGVIVVECLKGNNELEEKQLQKYIDALVAEKNPILLLKINDEYGGCSYYVPQIDYSGIDILIKWYIYTSRWNGKSFDNIVNEYIVSAKLDNHLINYDLSIIHRSFIIAVKEDLTDCIKKSRIQVVEEIPDLSTLEDGDIIIQL